MSYAIFKNNMLSYMSNQPAINSYEAWSKQFVFQYDMLIRRGGQIINKVAIEKGNTQLMEQLSNIACLQALQKRSGQHDIINNLGKAIVGYWTGATLNKFPIPVIPAVGSFQNIFTNSAIVTYPGKFPNMGKQFPTNNTGVFLDQLILGIQSHLFTLKGIYVTTSLYPGITPIVAPGFLQWEGYQVTVPATPSVATPPIDVPVSPFLQAILNIVANVVTTLSPLDIQVKERELQGALSLANDATADPQGRSTGGEYASLMQTEISSGQANSAVVPLSSEQLQQLATESPEEIKCGKGQAIVARASADVGRVIEYGAGTANGGRNWGGGGPNSATPGRIDAMLANTGLNNQAQVAKNGSGFFWCAGAVSTWWKEAGFSIPTFKGWGGPASCKRWAEWGQENGLWSSTPKIGAAIIYSSNGSISGAYHIGIVSGVLPGGQVMAIEGNTSGAGFARDGVTVAAKKATMSKVIGYVHPPDCG